MKSSNILVYGSKSWQILESQNVNLQPSTTKVNFQAPRAEPNSGARRRQESEPYGTAEEGTTADSYRFLPIFQTFSGDFNLQLLPY